MTTRGIRRKKSYLAEIKVAVIGAPGVGKSALTVRFLTKRYIGEYDHQAENRHKYEIMVDGEAVLCEIWDTCPKRKHAMTCCQLDTELAGDSPHRIIVEENAEALNLTAGSESVQWADGLLLVYSITDRDSFNYIRRAKEELPGDTPVALVANKVDMVHLRQVSTEEGDILAKDFECKFSEISAAEHVYPVADAFLELCREVLTAKRKSKQSFIDKIDRMLSGSRAYNRGKSDSISPKD